MTLSRGGPPLGALQASFERRGDRRWSRVQNNWGCATRFWPMGRRSMNGSRAGTALPELPPSERDFLVFEAVVVHGSTTRQAAAEFDLSQTRVMQVRRHVAEWIAKAVPDGLDLTPIQRECGWRRTLPRAGSIFCIRRRLAAWKSSPKPHTSVCRGRLTGETRTTRDSHGDPRYLLAAARLSERQLSLAGRRGRRWTQADNGGRESGVGDRQSGVDRRSSSSSSSSCSSSSSFPRLGFRVRGSGSGFRRRSGVGSRRSGGRGFCRAAGTAGQASSGPQARRSEGRRLPLASYRSPD